MKKYFAAILAILYFTVSSGATIHLHYCMGRLMSWDLSAINKNTCDSCGMKKAAQKGCCHDEHKQLKVEKDQKISATGFQFYTVNSALPSCLATGLSHRFDFFQTLDFSGEHAPPNCLAVPVYIRNCNFRI